MAKMKFGRCACFSHNASSTAVPSGGALACDGGLVGAAVISSLVVGLTLPPFLLGVALPLLPALLDVWEQFRSTKRAGEVRRNMADDIENAIRGRDDRELAPEDLLLRQDRTYELRRRSPQVPNLVYKRARDRNEHAMKTAAAELAVVAVRRSGGSDVRAGEH